MDLNPRAPFRSLPLASFRAGAHLPVLDGVRGLAVLIVVVLHFSFLQPRSPLESLYWRSASSAWVGVDLFFALSGFLITGILLDTRRSPNFFRNFYLRRTLRIFPLYYGFLFLVLLVLPLVRAHPPEEHQLWLWTYLGNVLFALSGWEAMPAHTTHLWSLAVEEQFYLIWPLVVYLVDETALVKICVAGFVLAIATRLGIHLYTSTGTAGYVLLPTRLEPLMVGSMLATLLRMPRGARFALRAAAPVAAGAAVVLLGVAGWSAVTAPQDSWLPALSFRVQLLAYPAIALLSGTLLVFAIGARRRTLLYRGLASGPMRALGRYSYAIYLFHIPLRDLARSHFNRVGTLPTVLGSQLPAQLALVAVGLLLSYAMALVSWHLFEKHFLALKDRWAPPTRGPVHSTAPGTDAAVPGAARETLSMSPPWVGEEVSTR